MTDFLLIENQVELTLVSDTVQDKAGGHFFKCL